MWIFWRNVFLGWWALGMPPSTKTAVFVIKFKKGEGGATLYKFPTWYLESDIFLQSQYLTASFDFSTSPCLKLLSMKKSSGLTWVGLKFNQNHIFFQSYLKHGVDLTNFLWVLWISFHWLLFSVLFGSAHWVDVLQLCCRIELSSPWWAVNWGVSPASLNVGIMFRPICNIKCLFLWSNDQLTYPQDSDSGSRNQWQLPGRPAPPPSTGSLQGSPF